MTFISHSAQQTKDFGGRLAKWLKPGDVVLLLANLGAGKTTLVQGLVNKLGISEPALSPTFVIAQSFKGKYPVHHLDFYRLTPREILAMGAQDYLSGEGEIPKGIVLIEWAERCKQLWPADRIEIRMRIKPRSKDRAISLIGHGRRLKALAGKIK